MICKACKFRNEKDDGFCSKCERIRNDIRRQKQKETENASRSCKECTYYRTIKGSINEFRCNWNNITYRRENVCFGFRTPTPPPTVTQNRGNVK